MRAAAFYLLLVTYAFITFDGVTRPYFDYTEAMFVMQILAHTKSAETGDVKVWFGPGVETDATILVSGKLETEAPPKIVVSAEPENVVEYPGCAAVWQEVQTWKKKNHFLGKEDWVTEQIGTVHVGKGLHIGAWAVDTDFLEGMFVPRAPVAGKGGVLPCRGGEQAECRVLLSCIPLDVYSVLGNRSKNKEGAGIVLLPDASLVNFPLFQSGPKDPQSFATTYKVRMAEMLMVDPLTSKMLVLGVLMLLLSRREVNIARTQFTIEGFFIWMLHAIITTNKGIWDTLTIWLVVGVPFLPALAYHNIPDPVAFAFCMQMSICGSLALAVSLWRRMMTDPATLPVREGDVAL